MHSVEENGKRTNSCQCLSSANSSKAADATQCVLLQRANARFAIQNFTRENVPALSNTRICRVVVEEIFAEKQAEKQIGQRHKAIYITKGNSDRDSAGKATLERTGWLAGTDATMTSGEGYSED